ncbi:MAG: type I-U CRISPR-associated protein Csb2 [Sutterellaceae bacterium]|nr:type I-U CRISPR-associated protein Csb2 [Burkholderiaceae bacterium]MDW8431058.1 type I-U CRISPR-associated protein Csb2 [Sutterellaceae bacterium]
MPSFAIGIRYLNGWAMAAVDGAKKEIPEWPPHPDRIFMALAAAWFETGQDPAEGEALRWLESLPPPLISASDAAHRVASKSDQPPLSYVPVNDVRLGRVPATSELDKLTAAGLSLLPEQRPRQPRRFPVAIPRRETVFMIWPGVDPGVHHQPLTALAIKVTHVGHSASFVQLWLEDEPPAPNWVPVHGLARHRLRIFGPGRLAELEARANYDAIYAYADLLQQIEAAKGKEKKSLQAALKKRFGERRPESRRPEPGLWQGYDSPRQAAPAGAPHTVFAPNFVVLALSGRRLSLPATLRVMEALRAAVQSACPQPVPEWVSGHAADGSPSVLPHLALVPLPFVGAEHADGRLLGAALVIPRRVESQEAARCLEPLLREPSGAPRIIKLYEAKWLECQAVLELRESPPSTLRPEVWTQPAREWASVTPVALDRHFDGPSKWERAAESLKDACERIGLPRPQTALVHGVSLLVGVPHAREFPRLTRKSDGGLISHVHAYLSFDQPVAGPIVIGAGRYRGYGFFRPLRESRDG